MDSVRVTGKAAYLIAAMMLATGCGIAPFGDRKRPRTPYARYQTLHGEDRPKTYTDSFGREQPALRARLSPLDAP